MARYREAVLGLVVALVGALGGGCATKIVPPEKPTSPVTVYVSDYGRHSSLLLPTGGGQLMEYAFGDWDYYALKKYRWYIGATALLASDQAGLGRRVLPHPGTEVALKQYLKSEQILAVDVEQERVKVLLDELDRRFSKNAGSMVYNDWYNQYIVKDETRYGLFNTCNGMTATWLERLGCEVRGVAVLANFVIEEASEETREGETATTQATAGATRPSTRPATTRVAIWDP